MAKLNEAHQIYLDFYSTFDKQKKFVIEKNEFYNILDYMTDDIYMGKDKMDIVVKAIQTGN